MREVLLGDRRPVELAVAAFLSGGHLLVEDTPGLGKTLLAKAMAAGIGGSFHRIQGTADLLPSEITGVSMYAPDTGQWVFKSGPVFANVVLLDELNRSTPRAQSALLEAMAESQVTVDGETHALPDPFFVIATQNPMGDAGTFPLVPGQRDRFAVSVTLGIPSPEAERALLLGEGGARRLPTVEPVGSPRLWRDLRGGVPAVHVDPAVADYVVAIIHHLRAVPAGAPRLSTRAALAVVDVARGWATLHGRGYVLPDDVKAVAPAVLGHRLDAAAKGGSIVAGAAVVDDVLAQVTAPPVG